MRDNKMPLASAGEMEMLQWFQDLPCGHRALLESALLAAAADIEIITESREKDTAAVRIGRVQGKLLAGLAEKLHGLSRRESDDPVTIASAI